MNFQVRNLCTTVMFFLLATSAAEGHTTTTVHGHEMSMMAWDWPGMGRGSLVPIGVILLLVMVILAFSGGSFDAPSFIASQTSRRYVLKAGRSRSLVLNAAFA